LMSIKIESEIHFPNLAPRIIYLQLRAANIAQVLW
jgi:hypothetical protein